ncbi:Probable amino-acid ABC transporter-binding protein HI_1080 precursor [Alysiella crassa]|uniref:Probable amino-acid ABC transporter-binding protein HI_1080 n=2 Tax=Alysiella crassa TaxID=153491 RepID=A0A376BU17_9NEIS|nr:Probable amino-acid ABC transporter-binding protein HI_1080 precursor [Alysiella crassa]
MNMVKNKFNLFEFKSLLSILLFTTLFACVEQKAQTQSTDQTDKKASSPQIKPASAATTSQQESVLVGTELNFPPFGFKDQQGQPTGFEVDLLKEIAQVENLNLQFVPLQRDKFVEGLQSKQYRLATAAIVINKERSDQVDFSDAILNYDREIYLLDNEKNHHLKTVADFKGKKLAASRSFNTAQDIVGSADNVIKKDTFYLALKAMYQGEVDGTLGDSRVLEYFIKQSPEIKTRKISLGEQKRDLAFAVQKGDAALLAKINHGLATVKNNGTYQKLLEKWFN